MGIVTGEVELSVDPLTAFNIAMDVEKYPLYMPNVISVDVEERRDDGYTRTAWVAKVDVGPIKRNIKWTEDEWWDTASLKQKFELVEGDYKRYSGSWEFVKTDAGSKILFEIDYDLGIPIITPVISKLLDNLMKHNIDAMLIAIKERAESGELN